MLDSVRVDRGKLLDTLKENKAKHAAEYRDAVEKYREAAEKALRKRAIEIRDGKTLRKEVDDLPEPKSFEDDYDRAISMVEWSAEDQLDLDERNFRAWVLDEWEWGRHFAAATSIYNAR